MQITGTVETILDPVTNKTYTSRKMWITTDKDTQYPQTVEVECGGAKANLFDNLKQGQDVTLDINLRGRKWEKDGKTSVFNSLSVWKVTASNTPQQQYATDSNSAGMVNTPESEENLPF